MKPFWFFVLLASPSFAQIAVTGTVRDAKTGQPLPFVSVRVLNTAIGTVSGEDGTFRLTVATDSARIGVSRIGYKPVSQMVGRAMTILLTEDQQSLTEVRVRLVNPAHRIVAAAVQNRAQNDPEQLASFQYENYSKSAVTTSPPDPASDRHLFVIETFSTRRFAQPNRSKEIITASRTSGTQATLLSSLSMLMQSFGFYRETITFQLPQVQEAVAYLNPLSPNSQTRYDFFMADTLLNPTGDSTFVIEFTPKIGAKFSGLSGTMHLNSTRFALEYVRAQTADPNTLLHFLLEQTYEPIDGQWFPAKQTIDWTLPGVKHNGKQVLFQTQSWLSNIRLNQPIPTTVFDQQTLDINPDAIYQSDTFWADKQAETLSRTEQNTYQYYQSLSAAKRFGKNAVLNVGEWLTAGVIPLGKTLDLGTQNLFDANVYEGFRPTINLLTNRNFSQLVRLDGKIAYGFRDKAWKYEGRIRVNLNEARRMTWTLGYRNDISEPANVQYFIWNFPQIPYELLRTFLISRADKLRQWKSELSLRALRYATVSLSVTDEIRTPTYGYKYANPDLDMWQMSQFHSTEVGLGIRYAYNEQFAQVGRGSLITRSPSPTISLHAAKGIMAFTGSTLDYVKVNLKVDYSFQTRGLGETFVTVSAGKTWGDLPYPYLYNGRGALGANNLIWVANHFQTMGLYEFASDQYANAFVTHNFKHWLGKPTTPWFQPELSVVQGIAVGSLRNKSNHEGIQFKTLEKGYFESGVLVDNLYRQKLKNLVYIGAGLGVFRRWGSYASDRSNENWAVRLVWNVAF